MALPRFPKAVAVFEAGIGDALTYLSFPGSDHAKLRTTNMLERLLKEVKRRTRVVGIFFNETSARRTRPPARSPRCSGARRFGR